LLGEVTKNLIAPEIIAAKMKNGKMWQQNVK
jgi:hypothetical protein